MKFRRTDLIDLVEAEIERRRADAAQRTLAAAAKHNEATATHIQETSPGWTAFADTIRKKVRAKQPITKADLPEALTSRFGTRWYEPAKPETHTARTAELEMLLGLLESTTDDEITDAALERLGAPVRALFRR